MAERSAVTQIVQLGFESTPGTPVAATKKLQTIDFSVKVAPTVEKFRPAGYKWDTVVAEQKEMTDATLKGQPTYTEIIYPLSSVITQTTPVTILDTATDTLGRRWVFEPSTSAPDNPLTMTVEQGSSVRAHRFAGCILSEFTLNFTRDKVDMGGKAIGTSLIDPFTLTASLPSVPLVPMLAQQMTVWLDTASAGLGTTKLGRVFSGAFSLTNRMGPVWVVDASQTSYVNTVELVPKTTFKVILEADAAGMALLPILRAGTTYFLRFNAVGPTIYSTGTFSSVPLTYLYQQDMAVKIEDVGTFSDQQGVYAIEFTFDVVHDATWGKAFHIEVVNKLTAL